MHLIRWSGLMLQILVSGLGLVSSLGAQGGPNEPERLHFIFSAGVQRSEPGESKPAALENQAVLHSGDRIKFFWEPKAAAHFFLFHQGPGGELALLFPADPQKAQVPAGEPVYVPEGPLWFELDAVSGTEKFILLASKSRLRALEGLCLRHAALKKKSEKESSSRALLEEISRLTASRQRKPLAAPAEKPVRIAGKFRSSAKAGSPALPDIQPLATEIIAPGFYSKTITIDHQ